MIVAVLIYRLSYCCCRSVVFNAVSSLSMVTGNGNAREQQRLTILYSLAREAWVEFSWTLIRAAKQYASAVCGVHVYVL